MFGCFSFFTSKTSVFGAMNSEVKLEKKATGLHHRCTTSLDIVPTDTDHVADVVPLSADHVAMKPL